MTADDKRIADLVAKVEKAIDHVKGTNERIAWCEREQHGRGASDYRVGLYYAECELEGLMLDLGDELIEEARALDMERAA